MQAEALDAVIITNLKNIYYLSGFWGTAGCMRVLTFDSLVILQFLSAISLSEILKLDIHLRSCQAGSFTNFARSKASYLMV